MKNYRFNFLQSFMLIALLSISTLLSAQFSLSGEFRPRAEYRHGFKTMALPDAEAAFQISQRTRLNVGYTLDNMKFGLSIQDVRLWGETPQLTSVSNRLMIHQAWAEYGFNSHFSAKVGRQELVYDDARIFGNVDWAQQARAHDLLLLKYESSFKLHAGLAFNQQSDQLFTTVYDMTSNYKSMQFLWFNKKFDKLSLSFLALNNGMEFKYAEDGKDKFKSVFSQTIGTHLYYKTDKTTLYGNIYFSTGKDAADRDLQAYNLMAGADYKLNNAWGVGAGYELLSGTSQKEKAANANYTNNSFNPFYGTNHKFNGFMDYFYVGKHINNVGLSDVFVNLNYKYKKASYQLTTHFFAAAADVLKPEQLVETMSNGFGTEVDLSMTYKLNDIASLSAGYSQMFGTETLAVVSGGNHKENSNWAWLMLSFKPVFFK